jgi:bifunctional DNA-binding transcriptional regulator/antitoxin component of YhaV-PrlF toxin-antitoxin module
MATLVGTKGQIVINKEIRDRLGIGPKWLALQRLVGDHVEVYFVPPEHSRSLMGCLAKYTKVHFETEAELDAARERAMEQAARDAMQLED